jgi:hypothetical protein
LVEQSNRAANQIGRGVYRVISTHQADQALKRGNLGRAVFAADEVGARVLLGLGRQAAVN